MEKCFDCSKCLNLEEVENMYMHAGRKDFLGQVAIVLHWQSLKISSEGNLASSAA